MRTSSGGEHDGQVRRSGLLQRQYRLREESGCAGGGLAAGLHGPALRAWGPRAAASGARQHCRLSAGGETARLAGCCVLHRVLQQQRYAALEGRCRSQRIFYTLFILIVYRFCTYVPLPGIDAQALKGLISDNQRSLLGMFNLFAGGAVSRMAIFALGIMPYISSSIIIQLLTGVTDYFKNLKNSGEIGRRKITQYTRYGTVLLALIQGYGVAVSLENSQGIVLEPGFYFRLVTTITLLTGTMLLMWLGEQITARGIGNGISLIIFAGIVAEIPGALASTFELGRTGAISAGVILIIITILIAAIYFIVFVERAQRKILIHYPKRQIGNKLYGGDASHLPLKVNTAGVIPAIFASALLILPITISNFINLELLNFKIWKILKFIN